MQDLTFRAFRKDNIYFRTFEEREKINYVSKQNLITAVNEVQEIYILIDHGRTLAEASIPHVLSFMAFIYHSLSLQLLDGHLDTFSTGKPVKGCVFHWNLAVWRHVQPVAYQQPTGSEGV